MSTLNATHDPARRSWVESANLARCDFPIQNLPYGRFRRAGSSEAWRIGVAIGDQILDLSIATESGQWSLQAKAPLARLAGVAARGKLHAGGTVSAGAEARLGTLETDTWELPFLVSR